MGPFHRSNQSTPERSLSYARVTWWWWRSCTRGWEGSAATWGRFDEDLVPWGCPIPIFVLCFFLRNETPWGGVSCPPIRALTPHRAGPSDTGHPYVRCCRSPFWHDTQCTHQWAPGVQPTTQEAPAAYADCARVENYLLSVGAPEGRRPKHRCIGTFRRAL